MHTTAFMQMVATLDRQLAPGGDGMAFSCLTQLATGVATELIGVQLNCVTGVSLGVRRSVGRLPVRPRSSTRLIDCSMIVFLSSS
jgi:hypothetical protein